MNDYAITDKNGVELLVGTIVKFQEGVREQYAGHTDNPDGSFTTQYETVPVIVTGRITRLTSKWVNIGGVWNGRVFAKRIPVTELTECTNEFFDAWSKTESYMCM